MPNLEKEVKKVQKRSWFGQMLPALTLLIMAPAVAEWLPGATRISAAFVFPIEMLIWGTGAVFARYFVRKFRLGWFNLVLLALALAMAEELLIQQTSFASLVVQIQHQEYGRWMGFNYVYFIWAVLYEAIFVVCVPVALCEMIYPTRKDDGWLNIWGMIPLIVLFVPACFGAWYGWNNVARVKVFHLAPYVLPQNLKIIGIVAVASALVLALGPVRRVLAGAAKPITPPHPLVLVVLGVVVAAAIYVLELLAFGIAPQVPTAAPVAGGLVLAGLMLWLVPSWMASPKWSTWHTLAMTVSVTWGTWAVMFDGFGGGIDLYGKIALDVLGVLLMLWIAAFAMRRKAA